MFGDLELLGADEIGFDPGDLGSIFEGLGEITKGGLAIHQKNEAEKKAAAAEKSSIDAATAADRNAAAAAAKAAVSQQLKKPSASIDQAAAAAASQASQRAAAKLSETGAEARTTAADAELNKAIANAQADPKDAYKAALVAAWTSIVNQTNNAQVTGPSNTALARRDSDGTGSSGESFLTRKVIGPVPGWGVVGIGAALAATAAVVAKKLL